MKLKKIIQAVIFFIAGLAIIWFVYRDSDFGFIKNELLNFNIFWISVSIFLNLLSQFIRAVRWKLLFKPLKYNPSVFNLFYSVLILAFTNQIIPRGGEFARLAAINKKEKIPFAKLMGTALAERLIDLILLLIIFALVIVLHFDNFKRIISLPQIDIQNYKFQFLIISSAIVLIIIILFFVFKNRTNFIEKFRVKINSFKADTVSGFRSIKKIKNKGLFLFLSVLIYVVWFFMLYVIYFSYPATKDLSASSAIFVFGLATIAFLIPIQAGMGAWHFLVIQSLVIYGISSAQGEVFALMAHASTNLVYLPLGFIAIVLLFFNKKPEP